MINVLIFLLILAFVWLTVLSFVFFRILRHYQNLTKDTKTGDDLKKILDRILENEELNKKDILRLGTEIVKLQKSQVFYVQKLGLVKFNPFNDTGGSQSFSLAVLDGNSSGLVMTGLHARERTRVYIKPVKQGKSTYELSLEEKKAIEQASKV